MAAAWTVLEVRGVPVRLHASLVLGVPYFAVAAENGLVDAAERLGVRAPSLLLAPWLSGVLLSLGLLLCIFLHEISHTLVARRFGGRPRSITLNLLGGVTEFDGVAAGGWGEGLLSAAGPATSLALAVACLVGSRLLPDAPADGPLLLFELAQANLVLAVCNLLPAFPLDGGRMLRSVLQARLGLVRAARVAGGLGRVLALALGGWALVRGQPVLILVAAFVYLAAGAEADDEVRAAAPGPGLRVADVLQPAPPPIEADASLDALERRLAREGLGGLLVVERGRVVGAVGLARLTRVPRALRGRVRVREAMAAPLPHVTGAMLAEAAARHMERLSVELLPVIEDDRLVGVVQRGTATPRVAAPAEVPVRPALAPEPTLAPD